MWVAKFKLRDDEDIYSPLCIKHKVTFSATPHTNYIKSGKINLLASGIISGSEQDKINFIQDLKKDKRIKNIETHKDYLFVHAQHPASRESRAEIKIFYNPEYILVKPVKVSSDGWEYWEIACINRTELNKVVSASVKYYHGELISIKNEKLKRIVSTEFMPDLTEKQLETLNLAYKSGYYKYPRKLTIQQLANDLKKSYSTFQENLRKAENKIMEHFLKYR